MTRPFAVNSSFSESSVTFGLLLALWVTGGARWGCHVPHLATFVLHVLSPLHRKQGFPGQAPAQFPIGGASCLI